MGKGVLDPLLAFLHPSSPKAHEKVSGVYTVLAFSTRLEERQNKSVKEENWFFRENKVKSW